MTQLASQQFSLAGRRPMAIQGSERLNHISLACSDSRWSRLGSPYKHHRLQLSDLANGCMGSSPEVIQKTWLVTEWSFWVLPCICPKHPKTHTNMRKAIDKTWNSSGKNYGIPSAQWHMPLLGGNKSASSSSSCPGRLHRILKVNDDEWWKSWYPQVNSTHLEIL